MIDLVGLSALAAVSAWVIARVIAVVGPVQIPNSRSSHKSPTAQSGGLGVVFAMGLAFAAIAVWRPAALNGASLEMVTGLSVCLTLCCGVAVLGAMDDVFDLDPRVKLAVLTAFSLTIAATAGPVAAITLTVDAGVVLPAGLALIGSALWVFTMMNATNFMDGANGLVAGAVMVGGGALAICAAVAGVYDAAVLAGLAVAGLAGFMPLNARRRARVFLGDAGALFLGAVMAAAVLMYASAGPVGAVFLGPLFFAPFLTDVLVTLAERAKRGAPLLEAHRDHAYQRALIRGATHQTTALGVWSQALACAALAMIAAPLSSRFGPLVCVTALALGVAVCLVMQHAMLLRRGALAGAAETANGADAPVSTRG